ncbi:Mur ligase middle domain protein [Enterococcus faecalis 13-SD-W-01]|nr:Mur ligase middle domain protein [Enterococcus faecalis 13-SD-W-01]
MSTIQEVLTGLDGDFYKEYKNVDQEVTNIEYFSGHLKKEADYSATIFVCITPERRTYINRKPVRWADGNSQIAGKENQFGLIVTEKPINDPSVDTPQFIVPDAWKFLLELSAKLRSDFTKPVVAITGSAGKTSTRMMITHLLQEKKILENRGNHNVRFAIPLYMSKLLSKPDLLNLEVSVNALNSYDTGSMSNLIQPDIALVTSIGEAHLSTLKDTIGVATHKAKIFEGLKKNGTAIINKDIGSKELSILLEAATKREAEILTYSLHDPHADVYVKEWQQTRHYCEVTVSFFEEELLLKLAVSSTGMISNALASLLVVWKTEKDIHPYLQRFETFRPFSKTLEKTNFVAADGSAFTFIDDTHNASLPAMKNAIDYFNEIRPYYNGKSFLVLGQIADLGDAGEKIHRMLQADMREALADHVLGYGEQFRKIFEEESADPKYQWFETLQDLSDHITQFLNDDSLILAKGSVTGSDFQNIDKYIKKIGTIQNDIPIKS